MQQSEFAAFIELAVEIARIKNERDAAVIELVETRDLAAESLIKLNQAYAEIEGLRSEVERLTADTWRGDVESGLRQARTEIEWLNSRLNASPDLTDLYQAYMHPDLDGAWIRRLSDTVADLLSANLNHVDFSFEDTPEETSE